MLILLFLTTCANGVRSPVTCPGDQNEHRTTVSKQNSVFSILPPLFFITLDNEGDNDG